MIHGTYCTAKELSSPWVRRWANLLGETWRPHRKLWEFAIICEAMESEGLLQPGCRAVGFGVGMEPLVALFASRGVEVTATDAARGGWFHTCKEKLNSRGICQSDVFERLVTFRELDMNWIPDDLTGFDFCWSCCSMDHLGSIRLSKRFVYESLKTLRSGGVAVHVGEFGPKLTWRDVDRQDVVVWNQFDVDECRGWLELHGHAAPFDHNPSLIDADRITDRRKPHIRLAISGVEATSFGLVIRKGA